MANETIAERIEAACGKPQYRKEGGIYFAENTILKMAYAVTTDRAKVGTIGIVNDMFVELISEQQGKLWDEVCQSPN